MAIDRMDWHYGGEYPQDLPTENGGTHIGFYLAWIINNHLEGEDHQDESADELAAVRKRTLSGREFLINMCDEKFWDQDLNEEGRAFTAHYYHTEPGGYFDDYERILAQDLPSVYHVKDSWENYDKLAPAINAAWQQWKAQR